MDKERARFILGSFRPNGADVDDADFAEALKLAHRDRELGEWLACERAFDADFAAALNEIPLPDTLREELLATLASDRRDFPQAGNEADAAMIGALSRIQPPDGLREKLIAAMELSTPVAMPENVVSFRKKIAFPLAAAAAGIALAIFLTGRHGQQPTAPTATHHRLSANIVEASFVKAVQSPDFTFEKTNESYGSLCSYLCDNNLPHPKSLPRGLENLKGLGCRELVIAGKRGSLICFNSEDGPVHLIVFHRDDMQEDGPYDRPVITQNDAWSYARWQDETWGYLLIGKTSPEKLAGYF
ncbi:MAG: hypothetical protein QM627_07115 [Luteolibacter sp.]